MSLYTFATTNFTTDSDLRRRAFIDGGQLLRTIALFALILATLILAAPQSDANSDRTYLDASGVSKLVVAAAVPRAHRSLPAARF